MNTKEIERAGKNVDEEKDEEGERTNDVVLEVISVDVVPMKRKERDGAALAGVDEVLNERTSERAKKEKSQSTRREKGGGKRAY